MYVGTAGPEACVVRSEACQPVAQKEEELVSSPSSSTVGLSAPFFNSLSQDWEDQEFGPK